MKTAARHTLAALGACALAGCLAKPPDYNGDLLAVDTPEGWQSTGARMGGPNSDWIATFRDRKLNSLAKQVEENNYDLRIAASRVAQAASDAKIAGATAYPRAQAGLRGQRQQQAFIGFPFGGEGAGESGMPRMSAADEQTVQKSLSSSFGLSLDIDWELDLWGRIRTSQSAAMAEALASRAEYGGLRSSLKAQTAKIWFAIQEANQQLELAEQTAKSFRESERTISDAFELADQPASQLRLAKSQTASAEALVEERKAQRKLAIRQLQILLGEYPSGEFQSPSKFSALPKPPPAGLPSDLIHRRADMIAAERRVAAADKRIKEAKLAIFPQIKLTGSGGTATETLSNVLNPDNIVWSIAGSAAQAVFAGGEIRANVGKRKALSEEAIANYQRTALNAFSEVENALTLEHLLSRRESALARSEEFLRDAYERALEEYTDGIGDVLTILTTQQQLLQAKSQVLSIRRLRLENRVDLHLALGGSFDARKASAEARKKGLKALE